MAAACLATALALPAASTALAGDAKLTYARLYPGPDGISHFATETLDFVPVGVPGVESVLTVHRLGDVSGAMVARLKAGATEDWHVAPRRQFMFCLRGTVEVTAGDGEKRRLRPGEFLLLEDVTGKGHRTHAAGPDDHVALAIPLRADPPASNR
jgi:quercetin dioxygenase-like cupin family protein